MKYCPYKLLLSSRTYFAISDAEALKQLKKKSFCEITQLQSVTESVLFTAQRSMEECHTQDYQWNKPNLLVTIYCNGI